MASKPTPAKPRKPSSPPPQAIEAFVKDGEIEPVTEPSSVQTSERLKEFFPFWLAAAPPI